MWTTAKMTHTQQALPLTGMRVVDLSHVIAGPMASFFLAQMGAEVIKVEEPGRGDIYRRPLSEEPSQSMSSGFVSLNAGKRSCAIDIRQPDGAALVRELAESADIFLENFRPGAVAKYGLDYRSLRELNPELIYCSVSAYGQSGSWSERGAYDHVIQAASGMMMTNGSGTSDEPVKVGFPVVDVATGWSAALAIVSAVLKRERFGGGEHIDASMMQASLALMSPLVTTLLTEGKKPTRQGNRGHSGSPAANVYRCQDGWIALGANTPHQMQALLDVLQLNELVGDPEVFDARIFTDETARFVRAKDPDRVNHAIEKAVAGFAVIELEDSLNARGVPAAKVRQVHQLLEEITQGERLTMPFTEYGATPGPFARTTGLGFHWQQEASPTARTIVPDLGDDTDAILLSLGKSRDEIARLRQNKVVA